MNGPIIQTDVEERLMILTDRLDKEVEYYATVSTERAINEATYKKLYATTLLQSEGTVATREALACSDCTALDVWSLVTAGGFGWDGSFDGGGKGVDLVASAVRGAMGRAELPCLVRGVWL